MARLVAIGGEIAALVARAVSGHGHRVLAAETSAEGIVLARAKRPALVIVAQRLPDATALDVCKLLKASSATAGIPIVVVADRRDELERGVARELGVADYLVVPFSAETLRARIEAAMAGGGAGKDAEEERIGCLTLYASGPPEKRVAVEGRAVDLTPVEVALLLVLCEGGERVCTRAELRERVWGKRGPDETRVVDQYVKRLRKKLGPAARYIETVHGVGYRFARGKAEEEGNTR